MLPLMSWSLLFLSGLFLMTSKTGYFGRLDVRSSLNKSIFIAFFLAAFSAQAGDLRLCDTRQVRGYAAKAEFRKIHECPSTGRNTGACPGWQVDHVIPLASCGCDIVENLQWLKTEIKTCAGSLCKDRWERKINTCKGGAL